MTTRAPARARSGGPSAPTVALTGALTAVLTVSRTLVLSLALAGSAAVLGALAGSGSAASAAASAAPTTSTAPASLGDVVIPNLGLGYAVTSQGPLDPSQFASNAPDPSAAAGALSTLGKSISTYERVWQADGGLNQVQDLLVRFPNAIGAQVFLQAAQHSLESGEIVSSNSVQSIPGARRVTYFAATNQDGVGEAITMRAGAYVDLLSFFSAASGNARPISPANAEVVAQAQYKAMTRAPGGTATTATGAPSTGTTSAASAASPKKGVSGGTIGVAVVAVAILALAVATPALLRRRRAAQEAAAVAADLTGAPLPDLPSDGDAVDDLREHSG
jgi:hypothetical protein